MLFVKKGTNKVFNDIKSLPPEQHSLNMKMLCASFAGYRISSCMQPVYQTLNPLDYVWQLIDGVHVLVWYTSLQLPTQEEINHHQETNYKNSAGNCFENEKSDSDDDMISDVEFNDDSEIN